jgi:hypothetical protein
MPTLGYPPVAICDCGRQPGTIKIGERLFCPQCHWEIQELAASIRIRCPAQRLPAVVDAIYEQARQTASKT